LSQLGSWKKTVMARYGAREGDGNGKKERQWFNRVLKGCIIGEDPASNPSSLHLIGRGEVNHRALLLASCVQKSRGESNQELLLNGKKGKGSESAAVSGTLRKLRNGLLGGKAPSVKGGERGVLVYL